MSDDELRAMYARLCDQADACRRAAQDPYFGTPLTAAIAADVMERCEVLRLEYEAEMQRIRKEREIHEHQPIF